MGFFIVVIWLLVAGWAAYALVDRLPSFRQIDLGDRTPGCFLSRKFWRQVWANPIMRRRVILTIVVIGIYKLIGVIPLPGVDMVALREVFDHINQTAMAGVPGIHSVDMSVFGAAYRRFSLLTLGLIPYVSACLLVQAFAIFFLPVKAKMFSATGRSGLIKLSVFVSVVVCAVQGWFYVVTLEKTMWGDILVVAQPGVMFRLVAVVSIVSALCLVLWLANMITEHGVGQGVAILIGVDILTNVAFSLSRVFQDIAAAGVAWGFYVVVCMMTLVMMAVVCGLTQWRKEMTLKIGPCSVGIPLRLSRLARVPVTLVVSLISAGAIWISFFPGSSIQGLVEFLMRGSIGYYIVSVFLISGIVYVYTAVLISPEKSAALIHQYGGTVDEVNDRNTIEDVLYARFERLTLWIAGLLVVFFLLPDMLMGLFGADETMAGLFGLGGFFILFGVLGDTVENIRAKMQCLEHGRDGVCLVTTDEIEACIQQCYLESQGIGCVLEPQRFTWGLPVKTAVDAYKIHVSRACFKTAVDLVNG